MATEVITPITLPHGCICAICICGKHRCPPVPPEPSKFTGQSTSHADYQKWVCPVHRHTKPENLDQHENVPFDAKTTNQVDYPGHAPAAPAQPFKPVNATFESLPFEGKSTYSDNYTGPIAARVRSMRPSMTFQSSGKFSGVTTNQDEFKKWNQKPRQPIKPKLKQNDDLEDRNFQTTNAKDFNDKGYQARRNMNPQRQAIESLPFSATTVHSDTYKAWNIEPVAPFRPIETVDDSADARTFETEASSKFKGINSRPAQPVRPSNNLVESGPFDGRTTNKSDFRGYSGARPPAAIRPPRVEVSNLPFQGNSSYASHYTGKQAERVQSVKPDMVFEPSGKFTATSTNSDDYRRWNVRPAESLKPELIRDEAKEDRSFVTESALQFNNKGYQVRRNRAPEAPPREPSKFDGVSTFRDSYRPHKMIVCPAATLERGSGGHRFYDYDGTAAKYKPSSSSKLPPI